MAQLEDNLDELRCRRWLLRQLRPRHLRRVGRQAAAGKPKLDRKAKGAVTIGTGTPKLVNGSVKFTVRARKRLKRVRKLKALLTVVATDAAGNSATTTLTIVLKN